MTSKARRTRRAFLLAGSAAGAGFLATGRMGWASARKKPGPRREQGHEEKKEENKGKEGQEAEVSPTEDLMREHGLLDRILLIYQDAARRIGGKRELDVAVLSKSAHIVRTFVEDYHEKLEEDYLFPRFEKAGQLVDLVKVLRAQHDAGRRLTDRITASTAPGAVKSADDRQKLAGTLTQFIRMYRPHAAREDTVLFPAVHGLVSAREFDALGEEFEEREDKLFGQRGFEKMVGRVAELEMAVGLDDLAKFTPTA